jgi:hypothetical protein
MAGTTSSWKLTPAVVPGFSLADAYGPAPVGTIGADDSARPGYVLTNEPDLRLMVDGQRLDADLRQGMVFIFNLPGRPVSARIVSRAGVPAELGLSPDPRMLGVAVRRIALRQGTRFRVISAAEAVLTDGFYPFEQATGLRWTDGNAALPRTLFDGFEGPTELVLHIGGTSRYPLFGLAERETAA